MKIKELEDWADDLGGMLLCTYGGEGTACGHCDVVTPSL